MKSMTKERKDLIDRFQKWLDTNPDKDLIAAQCATIAEEYHQMKVYGRKKEIPELEPVDRHFLIHIAYYRRFLFWKVQHHCSLNITKQKGGFPSLEDILKAFHIKKQDAEFAIILNICEISDNDYENYVTLLGRLWNL